MSRRAPPGNKIVGWRAAVYSLNHRRLPYYSGHENLPIGESMFGKCYEDLTPRLAIHPAQVGPIIEVFTPTEEEVEQTQTLIAAYETYQAADQGVLSFDGRMVD